MPLLALLLLAALDDAPLPPGDHLRPLAFAGQDRPYRLHVPPQAADGTPLPVVLVLHSFATPALVMPGFTGMSAKADDAGFLAVYPEGTGTPLRWNAGGVPGQTADDVAYLRAVLDDLPSIARVDPRRVYATGMSNGAMMCYRLAAELSDRVAAIAPVAGTMAIPEAHPTRPVPVIHFHGTKDTLVPYDGPSGRTPRGMTFLSVDASIRAWVAANGCPTEPVETPLDDRDPDDGTTTTRLTYAPGRDGAEVVLYRIDGGGHTWPGVPTRLRFLGNTSRDLDATDLIWDFFQRHPRP
jgi:polyhydroxybutyrate depolymerase